MLFAVFTQPPPDGSVSCVNTPTTRPRFGWALVGSVLIGLGCTPQGDPGIGEGFADSFDRSSLGEAWRRSGGNWAIKDGAVHVRGARNRPLWLLRTLPRDVRIEFDARSESDEGDIKVELFGDGASFATADRYVASGYVVIFGGWGNSKNVLARKDEHGADRVEGPPRKVEPGTTYRIRLERRQETVQVWVDDARLLEMVDPDPLSGRGHDHFGFNNWQSDVWFDNLKVTPL
ncbi:MAG: family 16 glycoside hydrolase [Polyangiales bacterium]